MKNIISKLGKSLLIPTLALSMNTKQAEAQKFEFKPEASFGGKITYHENLNEYPELNKHFLNLNGDEELVYKKINHHFNSQIGADIGIIFKNFSLGLTTRYYITDLKKERTLSAIELHNWKFDYARIYEFALKQLTPSIGAYVKFPAKDDNELAIKASVRNVKVSEIKREDKNLTVQLKCDVPVDNTDELTKEFERNNYKTLITKLGLELQVIEDVVGAFEIYYETDWKKLHQVGADYSVYFNVPKKKRD